MDWTCRLFWDRKDVACVHEVGMCEECRKADIVC